MHDSIFVGQQYGLTVTQPTTLVEDLGRGSLWSGFPTPQVLNWGGEKQLCFFLNHLRHREKKYEAKLIYAPKMWLLVNMYGNLYGI